MAIQNNNNLGTNTRQNLNSPKGGSTPTNIPARVIDIILDENHPDFKKAGGYPSIGAIKFEGASNLGVIKSGYAYPYNPHIKSFPLVNETVLIVNLPSRFQNDDPSSTTPFYINPAGLWNHPNHNAFINLFNGLKSSKLNNELISEVENGNPIQTQPPNIDTLKTNLNSPTNPSQQTFHENSKIKPLFPFPGDVIIEGRQGQSIRLGSTSKSDSIHNNNWSEFSSTKNGDPIVIIRNGQPLLNDQKGWLPITENANNDLSSFYLTSTQSIPIGLSNENFKSFSLTPFLPSNYSNSQIILNSSKITINSKKDDILLTSENNIGLLANKNLNLESLNMVLHTDNILKIGSKDSIESMLLGDKTYNLLKILIEQIINLSEVTSILEEYIKGENNPNSPSQLISTSIIKGLEKVKLDILPNIKSSKIKVE